MHVQTSIAIDIAMFPLMITEESLLLLQQLPKLI